MVAACGSARSPEVGPRGTLRLAGEPKDALVEIDEVHLGPIYMFEKKGLLLRPGEHRLVVRREGFFPMYKQVKITKDKISKMKIVLRYRPL